MVRSTPARTVTRVDPFQFGCPRDCLREDFAARTDLAIFDLVQLHLLGAVSQRGYQAGLARLRLAYLEAYATVTLPLTPYERECFDLAERALGGYGDWLPEQAISDARALGELDGLAASQPRA